MMEMVSRIRAVLRRTARQPSGVLSCGGVTLDEGRHAVTVNDRPVSLTLKEYELLKLFLENIGQVFSREALLSRVWDADYAGRRARWTCTSAHCVQSSPNAAASLKRCAASAIKWRA